MITWFFSFFFFCDNCLSCVVITQCVWLINDSDSFIIDDQ